MTHGFDFAPTRLWAAAEGSVRKTYTNAILPFCAISSLFCHVHFLQLTFFYLIKLQLFNKKQIETRSKHVNNFYSLKRCAKFKIT